MVNNMKKKKNFTAGMNVGSSSILVTFVLLCLVTFAALSFVSARSDYSLATQTADRISAYYSADTTAEIYLANADSLLAKLASTTDEQTFYKSIANTFSDNDMYIITEDAKGTFIHYEVPVSDSQSLSVTLKAVYPKNSEDDTFVVTEWENISTYVPTTETFEEEKGGLLF